MTQSGVLLALTASGQERDKSDTHKITISNKLATRYRPLAAIPHAVSPTLPPRSRLLGALRMRPGVHRTRHARWRLQKARGRTTHREEMLAGSTSGTCI
jgi:hypothetical protein